MVDTTDTKININSTMPLKMAAILSKTIWNPDIFIPYSNGKNMVAN